MTCAASTPAWPRVRDAEDAAALVELARFATGNAAFDELRSHLTSRVERFLDAEETAS